MKFKKCLRKYTFKVGYFGNETMWEGFFKKDGKSKLN